MACKIKAPLVKVIIDEKGQIQEVEDQHSSWYRPDLDSALPLSGMHYGWSIEDIAKKASISKPVYTAQVDVAGNDEGDKDDRNTISVQPSELLKLDVGFWGHYHRKKPQRNFGVICGRNVWLCDYKAGGASYPPKGHKPRKGSAAEKFFHAFCDEKYGAEVIRHAIAKPSNLVKKLKSNQLYVIFPDLHLPEAWPDIPPESQRHPVKKARDQLRHELREAQRQPSLLSTNPLSTKEQASIQEYFELMHLGKATASNSYAKKLAGYNYVDGFTTMPDGAGGVVTVPTYKKTAFTYQHVMWEKAVLDRQIQSTSCWFYPPENRNDSTGAANPDPCVAVDFLNLLCIVKKLKNDGVDVRVLQVGDLYELWMNHEFLYLDFPVDQKGAGSSTKLRFIKSIMNSTKDGYQYRMDRDWHLPPGTVHPIKRYVYNEWPYDTLVNRFKVGNQITPAGSKTLPVARLCRVLGDRVQAIQDFKMPDPKKLSKKMRSDWAATFGGDFSSTYDVKNSQGNTETLWNKAILDGLDSLGMRSIYGNHDGYRGDPLLKNGAGRAACDPWISDPGIWVEHGHRWDDYNRDGMAFGAGVTNIVYYYFDDIVGLDGTLGNLSYFIDQEREAFIPGAALWFLLINYGKHPKNGQKLDAFFSQSGKTVHPFGIYISGHTHSPELLRVRFELSAWASFKGFFG